MIHDIMVGKLSSITMRPSKTNKIPPNPGKINQSLWKSRPVAIYLKLLTTNRFMLKGTLNPEREINDIGDEETENSEGFKGRHLAPL